MKSVTLSGLLFVACFGSTALAQTVKVVNGHKVLIDRNGNVVQPQVPVFQPPSAPLVGGADSCVTPDVIVGAGPFAFDDTIATTGAQGQTEALCFNAGSSTLENDVWFTWTANTTGAVNVSMCGQAGFDSKLAVYLGNTCPASGSALVCDDDFCYIAGPSQVTLNVTTGTQYVIQIGNYLNGNGGIGTFTIAPPPPPPTNDSCTTPISIVGTGSFAYDTTLATTGAEGQNESLCNQFGITGINTDLWYTWVAPFSGPARVTNCGATIGDTKFAAYAGAGCPVSGTAIACNDQACQSNASQINFTVTQGNSYTLQIGDYPFGLPGPGTFTISQLPPPPVNDSCTTPIAIVGTGSFPFDTSFATAGTEGQTESLCNTFGITGIDSDLWYSWVAPFSGTARVATCGGTNDDTKIAAYSGSSCPVAGSALACNDNACGGESQIDITVSQGSSYLLQIGDTPGFTSFAPGTFTVSQYFPIPVDDCQLPQMLAGPGTYMFDSSIATNSSPQGGNCTNVNKDLWYTYAATTSGSATITTCGLVTSGDQDTVIAVYAGTGCPSSSSIACDDDDFNCGTGLNSTVTWPTTCGQSYTVQLGSYLDTYNVTGQFNIAETGTQCGPTGVPFCFGDGTGTACPCANNGALGNGCASSVNANGANLTTTGFSSLANDTLVLRGVGMSNSSCLYFQGTSQSSVGFGDGLRCAGGTVTRLGTKTNVGGSSQYPTAGNPSVSVRGAVMVPGTRTYQTWYRNAAAFCTPSTFNLTNGMQITWQ